MATHHHAHTHPSRQATAEVRAPLRALLSLGERKVPLELLCEFPTECGV